MKKKMRPKSRHFLPLILALAFTSTIEAQISASTNKVKNILKEVGRPVEVYYEDGRVAQVITREKIDQFRIPVTLSDNSCKEETGLKCTIVLPFIRQQFAATWKVHPTRQGKELQYRGSKDVTFGGQTFVTRSQNQTYETILNRMASTDQNSKAIQEALAYKNMARLECESDVTSSFPNSSEILYWDEYYEAGIKELAMSSEGYTRVNLIWRRNIETNISAKGNVVQISRFKKAMGPFTDLQPFGLAYEILMSFKAPNVNNSADELCRLKWSANFSNYFTQILSVTSNGGYEAFNPNGYSPLIFSYENPNPYARAVYENKLWEEEGME